MTEQRPRLKATTQRVDDKGEPLNVCDLEARYRRMKAGAVPRGNQSRNSLVRVVWVTVALRHSNSKRICRESDGLLMQKSIKEGATQCYCGFDHYDSATEAQCPVSFSK